MAGDRMSRPPIGLGIGRLVEPLYRTAVARRNAAFDRGERVVRAGVPVISVGNLSVGGTGKTPMVMLLARWLIEAGERPGIALRGYGGRAGDVSDEHAEYRAALPGVAVEADPTRIRAVEKLVREHGCSCVILDDGFQHRFVARDLDIVLVDATRDPRRDRCLPAGWLREPLESLARAHVAVITHAERVGPLAARELLDALQDRFPNLRGAIAEHAWSGIAIGDRVLESSWIAGRRVIIACGIGNPHAFIAQAERHGALIADLEVRPDHHAWTVAEARGLVERCDRSGAAAILTTGKDWVKLASVVGSADLGRFARPVLEVALTDGGEGLKRTVVELCTPSAAAIPSGHA